MNRRVCILTLALAVLAGCKGMSVNTRARISLEKPFQLGPPADAGPIQAKPIGCDQPVAGCPQVAVIDVDGVLLNETPSGFPVPGTNPVAEFAERLEAAGANPLVRAVVLRINSPGGSVNATDIMVHELQAFRKRTGRPVVACILDVATGGAYYLASGTDVVIAHPTSVTGGVGVIINLYNLREQMATWNILDQSVKAGESIDVGTVTRALEEEDQAMLQVMADEFHQRFIAAVRANRPALPDEAAVFGGGIFTGTRAVELGLVDRAGYLSDALATARQLGGCPNAAVVMYRRPEDCPRSLYETPAAPSETTNLLGVRVPGLTRAELPLFLYMWLPEPLSR